METQFPPSSPLIGNEVLGNEAIEEEQYVKSHFKALPVVVNDELPTPNPSSSIGDVNNQSVIYEEEVEKRAKIDKANPLSPHNFKRVLQVPLNGEEVRIGRSSNVCNFQLTSKNKSISRLHLKIKYLQNENACELKCIGYNGVNVTIPVMSNVHNLGDHRFSISVLTEEKNEKIDKSRLLEMNKDFTNFYMLRYETIKMPLINGTVLDIKGELILLQYPVGRSLDIEKIKSIQEKILLASNAEEDDDANKTVESLSSDFDVVIDPRPIEKKDMVNSFIYKEATPECSFAHSTPIDTPIADKSFMILEDENRNVAAAEEVVAAEHVGLPEVSGRTPLGVIRDQQLNIASINTTGLLNKVASGSTKAAPKSIESCSLSKSDTSSFEATDSAVDADSSVMPQINDGIVDLLSTYPGAQEDGKNDSLKEVEVLSETSTRASLPDETSSPNAVATFIDEAATVDMNDEADLQEPLNVVSPKAHIAKLEENTPSTKSAISSPKISSSSSPKTMKASLEKDAIFTKSATSSPKPRAASLEKPTKGLKRTRNESNDEHLLTSMTAHDIDTTLAQIKDLSNLCNIIINHIAYSRILQTPLKSILDLSTMRSLSKHQLRCMLIHHIPCIGVIFRKGKDAAGKPLDEEYYYIPERDDDQARVQLVEDVKGSSSHLRSCRKTHKQYFWKKPRI